MALPLFYIDEKPAGSVLVLNEETSRHVVQVLRMKKGEHLQLTDGKGTLHSVVIADDHKKHCTVNIAESKFFEQVKRPVSIAISLLKNATRFEWFLEKATEIGVTEIVPLRCERTEKQHFRFDRMNNILVAAMLQSQQFWLPVLHQPTAFEEAVANNTTTQKFIAHCIEAEKRSLQVSSDPVQVLIGPEGDFSPGEIEQALAAGYLPVTLGNTRLRTETAGVVAATLLCI